MISKRKGMLVGMIVLAAAVAIVISIPKYKHYIISNDAEIESFVPLTPNEKSTLLEVEQAYLNENPKATIISKAELIGPEDVGVEVKANRFYYDGTILKEVGYELPDGEEVRVKADSILDPIWGETPYTVKRDPKETLYFVKS